MANNYIDYSEPGNFPKVMGDKSGYAEAVEARESRLRADKPLSNLSKREQRIVLQEVGEKIRTKRADARKEQMKMLLPGKLPAKSKARKMPSYYKGTKKKPGLAKIGQSIAATFAGTQTGQTGGSVPGRGRGRPTGTYQYMIPGVGLVPIQVYKKYQSQMRRQVALQQALRQAQLSAVPPADNVRGGYPDAEDQWLAGEDYGVDTNSMQQMPQNVSQGMPQRPRGPSAFSKIGGALSRLGNATMGGFGGQQMAQQGYGQGSMGMAGQPRITLLESSPGSVLGTPSNNILNSPNIFNRPGTATIGIRR